MDGVSINGTGIGKWALRKNDFLFLLFVESLFF
jgi:hypothetical protein